jgi:Mce-associated membrane protein
MTAAGKDVVAERDGGDPGRQRSRTRRAWRAGWALIVLAVAFTAWSGWSYWQADHSAALSIGRARDDALLAGSRELADLNSVNDKQIAAWQQRWLDASTGTLSAELRRTQAQSRNQITRARTSAQATVVGAAVTELDQQAGTAQLIASVLVQVTPDGGAAVTERNRYQAGLTRTPGGWRVSSLTAFKPAGS